jgi:ABC-type proline/glycine betaine transport system substrate-binding protein
MEKYLDEVTVYKLRMLASEAARVRAEAEKFTAMVQPARNALMQAEQAAGLAEGTGYVIDGPKMGLIIDARTGKAIEFSDPQKAPHKTNGTAETGHDGTVAVDAQG